MARITIKDDNRIPELMKELEYLRDHRLEIGIFGDDDSFVLMIARVHEFGIKIDVTPKMRAFLHHIGIHLRAETTHINIPERSYMRSTVDNQGVEIDNMVEAQIGRVLTIEQTAEAALSRIGEYVAGLVKRRITELRSPALHQVTIERKGSSNPLIDTGRLRMSVTWRIVAE